MFDYEVVGCVYRGFVLCNDCAPDKGHPVFAGSEDASNYRCDECGFVLSGDDETRDEQEARAEEERRWAEELAKEKEAFINKQLESIDADINDTAADIRALEKELREKMLKAASHRAALLQELANDDEV